MTTIKTASDCRTMSANEVLSALCPGGQARQDVYVEQNWDRGETTVRFDEERVMPEWMAPLTPWIEDSVSADAWSVVIRRYAALARRWSVLDDAAWERARVASLIAIVSEARTHCPPAEVRALAAIDGVLEWLRRGAPESDRAAVSEVALRVATEAALRVVAWPAVAYAAAAVAYAATETAAAAASHAAAETAAAAASYAAAADRIATAVLDAIEAEIEREER